MNGGRNMKSRIFYTSGISFASGIFLRSFFDTGVSGILLTITVGGACLCAWMIQGRARNSALFLVGLFCMVTALGMARLEYTEKQVSPYTVFEGEKMELEARVVQEPDVRETTTHLYVVPLDTSVGEERILVTADRFLIENEGIGYGDSIRVEGTLKKPQAFMTDTGRAFDYAGFLRAKGVWYTISYAEVTLITHEETRMGTLFQGKHAFLTALERALPEPASGLGEGMLLGVKRALGEHLDTVFREVGIIHIVVLSGYNIMVVVVILTYFLAFVFSPRMNMVVGSVTIVLFALLVGLSATVMRASLMAILLLIARGTGKTYAVLRALMFSGMVMLVWNPYLLMNDPGFQLSFLATLGLILFSPHIEKHLVFIPEKYGMRSLLTATLSTQVVVLPLLLYHTGMVSLIGVITNMLVLPMVPTAMILTFVTGVCGLLSDTLGIAVGYSAYLSLQYVIVVAEICARVPFATVTIATFPSWGLVVAYAGIVWAFVRLEKSENGVHWKSVEVTNEYEGWEIEEDREMNDKKGKPEEALRTSSGSGFKLPFR